MHPACTEGGGGSSYNKGIKRIPTWCFWRMINFMWRRNLENYTILEKYKGFLKE